MNSLVILALCLVAVASAQQRYPQILRQSSDVSPDGQFQYSFQTEDGINVEARGTPIASVARDASSDGPATAISGRYSYTGPDGVVYSISYVADENGYRPSGAHLPVAPPIPAAIQRSLEQIARNPQPEFQSDAPFQPQQPQPQPQRFFAQPQQPQPQQRFFAQPAPAPAFQQGFRRF